MRMLVRPNTSRTLMGIQTSKKLGEATKRGWESSWAEELGTNKGVWGGSDKDVALCCDTGLGCWVVTWVEDCPEQWALSGIWLQSIFPLWQSATGQLVSTFSTGRYYTRGDSCQLVCSATEFQQLSNSWRSDSSPRTTNHHLWVRWVHCEEGLEWMYLYFLLITSLLYGMEVREEIAFSMAFAEVDLNVHQMRRAPCTIIFFLGTWLWFVDFLAPPAPTYPKMVVCGAGWW